MLFPLKRLAAILGLICLLSALLPAATAAKDFADCLPADSMLCFQWDFSADAEARFDKSTLAKFLQEKETKEFLNQVIDETGVAEVMGTHLTRQEAAVLLHGRVCAWINRIESVKVKVDLGDGKEFEYERPVMHWGLLAEYSTDEAKKAAAQVMERVEKTCREQWNAKKRIEKYDGVDISVFEDEEGGPFSGMSYFNDGDIFALVFYLDDAKKIIDLLHSDGAHSLAKTDLYKQTRRHLDKDPIISLFVNLEKLFPYALKYFPEGENSAKKIFDYLKITDAKAAAITMTADQNEVAAQFHLYTPATTSPLFKLLHGGQPAFKSMRLVKQDAMLAFAATLKPADEWELIKGILSAADKPLYDKLIARLKDIEDKSGLNLEKDIIASIGPEAALIITDPEIDLRSPFAVGLVVAIEIKDGKKIEQFIATALGPDEAATEQYNGHTLYTLKDESVFCITENHLLYGSTRSSLKEVIKTLAGNRPLLVDDKKYLAALAKLDGNLTAVGYVNLARFFDVVNNLIETYGDDIAPKKTNGDAPAPQGEKTKPPAFPVEIFKKYFSALLISVKSDENGITVKMLLP